MSMADSALTLDVIAHARQLASRVHHNDVLETFPRPKPPHPDDVGVEIDSMGNNPERVRSFLFRGTFAVDTLVEAAHQVHHHNRAEVTSCWYFGSAPDPLSWVCSIEFTMQHRGQVDELRVKAFVLAALSIDDDPRSCTQPAPKEPQPVVEPAPVDRGAARTATPAILSTARHVAAAMHRSDLAADVRTNTPDLKKGVMSVELHEFGAAATRQTKSASVFGAVDVSMVVAEARRWEDRPGTPMTFAWFDALGGDDPAHGAAISMVGKPGDVIGGLHIEIDRLDAAGLQIVEPSYAVIGSIEALPAFDEQQVVHPGQWDVLQSLRASEDAFWELGAFELEDPAQLHFGCPPAFAPVVNLMTDGMRLGFMVDAPELCPAEPYLSLFGFSMEGCRLLDHGSLLTSFVARRIGDLRDRDRSTGEQSDWEARALGVLRLLGYDNFGDGGAEGFASGVTRARPQTAPKGSKWRNDSSGNGVLADKAEWGSVTVRRPKTTAAALRAAAGGLAPAASLWCAQEALVLANTENSPSYVADAYAAMVPALEALGRPQVAVRAAALANIDVER